MTCSPGDTVVTESPIYAGALDLFHAFSARMHPVGSFDDPRVLETLERGPTPSLVYASSAYRNPAGTVLDARSAARLARWSARTETPVVDDRALAPCGFTPIQPRPLAAYAPDAPILTLGSFDKLTGAGTRIGWIRAPRSMVAKAVRLKALSDLASPPYLQRVAIHLCDDAEAFAQARRLELTRRYETMARHLRARFPHWRWETPQGGASIWIDLGSDADAFARAAGRAGVSVVPGAAFRPEGTSASYIRLAFARPEAQLVMAVERLASVRLTR
jgi:DNA-binding transcriptional MocR family regulator